MRVGWVELTNEMEKEIALREPDICEGQSNADRNNQDEAQMNPHRFTIFGQFTVPVTPDKSTDGNKVINAYRCQFQ